MANWIRLDNHLVVETTDIDPKGRFHADIKWVKAPDTVLQGMVKAQDGSYALPPQETMVIDIPERKDLSVEETAALEAKARAQDSQDATSAAAAGL